MNRIPKSFSFSSEEEYQTFLDVLANFAGKYPQLNAKWGNKINASTVLKKIASGEVDLVYTGVTEIYEPLKKMVEQKQPFRITYKEATGKTWGYNILFAKLVKRMHKHNEINTYIDCWCFESATNFEITELAHNWSFRAEQEGYKSAKIEPILGEKWKKEGRDKIEIEIEFNGDLAWEYERSPEDVNDSGPGEIRKITKKTDSIYWLMKKLAPQAICNPGCVRVLSPQSFCEKWMTNISSLI